MVGMTLCDHWAKHHKEKNERGAFAQRGALACDVTIKKNFDCLSTSFYKEIETVYNNGIISEFVVDCQKEAEAGSVEHQLFLGMFTISLYNLHIKQSY